MGKPRKITLKNGSVVYRIVIDAGRDPETGKRRQITRTFGRKKEADAELARVGHQRATGTYVPPSKMTLAVMLDGWLQSACFEKEEATRSNDEHALRPARERLGHRLVQSITREDIEDLRNWMLTAGRKRGGTPGTGLGPRSVRLTLSRLSAAFDQALDDGKVTRNPVARVRRPKMSASTKTSWSEDEARQFLTEAAGDWLHAAWRMALYAARVRKSAAPAGSRTSTWRPGRGLSTSSVSSSTGRSSSRTPRSRSGAPAPCRSMMPSSPRSPRSTSARPPRNSPPGRRTPAAAMWSATNWGRPSAPNGSPMSSAGSAAAPGCGGSPCTRHGTPRPR